MFTTHLKLKNTGWEECTLSAYAQIYTTFGGSVCTHPRVLAYLSEREGVRIQYYMKRRHGQPIAGVFSVNGSLAYKNSTLPFVFDDLILPIKAGEKVILPFKTKRLSPHSQGIIFNSISHNLFKKKMAHIKSDFSVKTLRSVPERSDDSEKRGEQSKMLRLFLLLNFRLSISTCSICGGKTALSALTPGS